jgi:hypothetical protein
MFYAFNYVDEGCSQPISGQSPKMMQFLFSPDNQNFIKKRGVELSGFDTFAVLLWVKRSIRARTDQDTTKRVFFLSI